MSTATEIFEAERAGLMAMCYRMLGERAGAEDAVQDTWLRWEAADKGAIREPAAWLRRVATNIAIDALRAARRKREHYVGPWLPEPLMPATSDTAETHFLQAQECELALLWAMERLTERERAAFILRQVFDAGYEEIARALGTTQSACRQMVSRSQKKLRDSGPKFAAPPEEVAALSQRFFGAIMARDFDTALHMMTPQTVALSDGGAKTRAARRPLVGGPEIIQVFAAIVAKSTGESGWSHRVATVNARPALLRFQDGVLESVTTLAPGEDGRVAWIYVMRNPDKLGALAAACTKAQAS